MAEYKKYLDTTGLSALVDQIKAEDAKVLAAAEKYTDDAGKLYDAAGSASGALASAKEYTDALANGQVATNKADIAKLNGDATTEGSVAKAVADAKALVDADVEAVEAVANKNKEDIAAINNAETGILAQAKKYADDEDAKVEESVATVAEDLADLEAYVGTIPADATATDIVGYVQEKTAGIATDAALENLTNRVTQAEKDIDAIEADYLKAADKTELQGKIDAEAATRKSDDEALAARIKVVEDDYLKAADKTELAKDIATNAAAIERLTNGVSAEEIDGVNDLIQYVKDHGSEVTGMQEDISKNAEDIVDVAGRMTTAEGKITAVEGAVATKVEQEAYDTKIAELAGVDTGLGNRITALENKFGDGEGSVEDMIADAQDAAVATAAEDATSKANKALEDAKAYTDAEVGKDRARLDAIEAIEHHSHSNKAVLDGITEAKVTAWNDAVAKAHEHGNKTVLDGITAENITTWNTVTSKAAQTDLEAAVARIAVNEGAISTINTTLADKADADDLDAAVTRIAKNETDIAALTSSVNSFTPITADEVNALFA